MVLWLGCQGVCWGSVTWQAYEANGTTPFANRQLLVGEKLVLICHSTESSFEPWQGFIGIPNTSSSSGKLTARGPYVQDWVGSHLPAAGLFATVWNAQPAGFKGFQVSTDFEVIAGNWFVLDYEAKGVGDPNISCFELSGDPPVQVLTQQIFLHQVPTRDLSLDNQVDWLDWVIFSQNWGLETCLEPLWCSGADLNRDGLVDILDLALFTEYWLYHIDT